MNNDGEEYGGEAQHGEDQIWGGDERDLAVRLERRYGVETLWMKGDFQIDETGEIVYDAVVYFDGDEEHLIADDLTMLGHAESGAVGVEVESLPSQETVDEAVQEAEA